MLASRLEKTPCYESLAAGKAYTQDALREIQLHGDSRESNQDSSDNTAILQLLDHLTGARINGVRKHLCTAPLCFPFKEMLFYGIPSNEEDEPY